MSKKHFNQRSLEDGKEIAVKSSHKKGKNFNRDRRESEEPTPPRPMPLPGRSENIPGPYGTTFETGDGFSRTIGVYLFDQMTDFVYKQADLDGKTVNERKDAENALFNVEWGVSCKVANPLGTDVIPEYNIYMVDRSVRIDRDTHKLNRASCTIIAISAATGKISYTVTAYLTNRFTGTVAVVPVGDDGPKYKESVRYNFNMSDQA